MLLTKEFNLISLNFKKTIKVNKYCIKIKVPLILIEIRKELKKAIIKTFEYLRSLLSNRSVNIFSEI